MTVEGGAKWPCVHDRRIYDNGCFYKQITYKNIIRSLLIHFSQNVKSESEIAGTHLANLLVNK